MTKKKKSKTAAATVPEETCTKSEKLDSKEEVNENKFVGGDDDGAASSSSTPGTLVTGEVGLKETKVVSKQKEEKKMKSVKGGGGGGITTAASSLSTPVALVTGEVGSKETKVVSKQKEEKKMKSVKGGGGGITTAASSLSTPAALVTGEVGSKETKMVSKQKEEKKMKSVKGGGGITRASSTSAALEPTNDKLFAYIETQLVNLLDSHQLGVRHALQCLTIHMKSLERINPPFVNKTQFKELCKVINYNFKPEKDRQFQFDNVKEAYKIEIQQLREQDDEFTRLHQLNKLDKDMDDLRMRGLMVINSIENIIKAKGDAIEHYDSPWPESTKKENKKKKSVNSANIAGSVDDFSEAGAGLTKKASSDENGNSALILAGAYLLNEFFKEWSVEICDSDQQILAGDREFEEVVIFGNTKVKILGETTAEYTLYLDNCVEGQIELWKKATIERVSDKDVLTYISNLEDLENDPSFITLKHVFKYKNEACLLVDRYGQNLRDIITDDSAKRLFWTDVSLGSNYESWRISKGFNPRLRPSRFFQRLLREIVAAMVTLYENDIPYDLSCSTIVFLEGDARLERPKLRYIFSVDDSCKDNDWKGNKPKVDYKLRTFFMELKTIINDVMYVQGVAVHDVAEDVKIFINLLNNLEKKRLPELTHHPVMWHPPMKLMFYIRWYKLMRLKRVKVSTQMEKAFVARSIFPNWFDEVKENPSLELKMKYAEEKFHVTYDKQFSHSPFLSLMKYIRDTYEHLNEKMENSIDENGNLVGHDFASVVHLTENEFDTILEFFCPKLAEFLIEETPGRLCDLISWEGFLVP